jgi:hypothetical protein
MADKIQIANFDIAGDYYNKFLKEYADPHNYNGKKYDQHIPSSFVYGLIKDNCVWLLTLIMGVAGYRMYFDDDTIASRVISKEALDAAGVQDPVLRYKSSITPWEGTVSSGKRATDPVKRWSTGVGICHYQGEPFKYLYKGEPVIATLPIVENGKIKMKENGEMEIGKFNIYYKGKPVCGWGMSYSEDGLKMLPLSCVSTDTSNLSYCTSITTGKPILKGNTKGYWKFIGGPSEWGKDYYKNNNPSTGQITGKYMSESEAKSFRAWCEYHFNNEVDALYPALQWMSKYWAPAFSWPKGNSLNFCIYAAGYANSGFTNLKSYYGQSVEALKEAWPKQGRPGHEHRTANLERVEALVEFIKRVPKEALV